MTTGEKIRRARLADPAISQLEVSSAVGLSRPMIALMELGYRTLTPSRAAQILAAIERLRAARRFADSVLAQAAAEARQAAQVYES